MKEHKEKHIQLHKCLSELVADFIESTNQFIEISTINQLIEWSYLQAFSNAPNEVFMNEPKSFPENEMQLNEIFIKDSIYSCYRFDKDKMSDNIKELYKDKILDAYCPVCRKDSVFHIKKGYIKPEDMQSVINSKIINLTARCVRSHPDLGALLNCPCSLYFTFIIENDLLIKIGQYPSKADLDFGIIAADPAFKELKKDMRKELGSAVGLRSHNIGIGSYVYLRRIFEKLLEESYKEAEKAGSIDTEKYKQSRIKEKIQMLKSFLPLAMVETANLYSILSKGIHELAEDECLKHFDIVMAGIKMILREKYEKREYDRVVKDLNNMTV